MIKFLKFFCVFFIIVFFLSIYKFYSSENNIQLKNYNRINIDKILNDKKSDLPVLKNDTKNVIQFNDGFTKSIEDKKPRNFWDLLKIKWKKKQL